MFHVQPREWLMLVLLIAIPLAIAVVVTLWSIKQMAYTPKKPARPKLELSAEDLARLVEPGDGVESPGSPAAVGAGRNIDPPVVTPGASARAHHDGKPERAGATSAGGGHGSV